MSNWHSIKVNDVIDNLKSTSSGLTNKEAQDRLLKYGKNVLPKKKNDSFIKLFFEGLFEPMEILLIIAMIFSFAIHEIVDGYAILFIILIDVLMGTYQEWKANKNAEALRDLIKDRIRVLRDDKEIEIDSSELVIGDVVLLESGDKISADLRIMTSTNLQVDESILTGESISVYKSNTIIKENTPLAERFNMLYAGTNVLTGRAKAIVVATSINTEVGKIAKEVTETKETKSPLTIRMEKFSKEISILVIIIAVVIAITLYLKGTPVNIIFLSVIALSVSAMPEGLGLALTMALTIAANRMRKKNVIVKKLNAVESLGSCTVIASDKTGTLTVNEQTVKKIVLANGDIFEVTGTGYNDNGKVKAIGNANIMGAYMIGKLGTLNNEAVLSRTGKRFESFGDSIDIAFLALGLKLKVDIKKCHILKNIPYESENKYSAVYYEEEKHIYCSVKGSLEKVLDFCTDIKSGTKITKLDKDLITKQNEELAKEGYRVIAVAYKEVNDINEDLNKMHFLGLVAFIDPIRKEVLGAIKECKKAGIKVSMITGDHPLTAFAIAKELNLVTDFNEVTTGSEVEEYLLKDEKELDNFIKNKRVFTRVTPLNKLKIIELYKRQGEFVAVTGDGVNDAPAIKAANIGISMGSGTDVAKETASLIITDDNFNSIVAGIKEGRNAYSNIRKVSYLLLSCGVAEILFFLLSVICNMETPLLAVQLLWLNIVTDGLQDFALSFESAEEGIMEEKPRSPKESIFNKTLLNEVLISGVSIGLIVFGVWVFLLNKMHMEISTARGYIMVLMVFMQNMHVLNCRSEKVGAHKVPLNTNPLIVFSILSAIFLQILVSEVPFLSSLLQTSKVPVLDMLIMFILSTIIIIIMNIYKKVRYRN
ncbi:MAG: cation-translocating P-type ATPase [Bacilli bacterium]